MSKLVDKHVATYGTCSHGREVVYAKAGTFHIEWTNETTPRGVILRYPKILDVCTDKNARKPREWPL